MGVLAAAPALAQTDPLAKAAAEKGAVVTDSGLVFRVLREGKGPMPKATDTVRVNYRGTFPDGREFDSSYSRGEAGQFSAEQGHQVLDRRAAAHAGGRQGQSDLPGGHRLWRARCRGWRDPAECGLAL